MVSHRFAPRKRPIASAADPKRPVAITIGAATDRNWFCIGRVGIRHLNLAIAKVLACDDRPSIIAGTKETRQGLAQWSELGASIMNLATFAVILVAALHVVFFILESVLWTSPKVRRAFGNTAETAEATRVLALNQGFYNLGVAVLLLWFHAAANVAAVAGVLVFIAAMGVVGAVSASRAIIVLQTLPALVALLLMR